MSAAERVPVLMYHRVGDVDDDQEARFAISAERFASHMRAIARARYRVIGIDAFVEWLYGGAPLPERALLITFDDGYRGVRDHALPILERLGWPFAVFLVSDLIGAQDEWKQRTNPAAKTWPLLDVDDIRHMQSRGCSFHSHSRSHARLPAMNDDELADELQGSRARLEEILRQDVRYLAYPFGQADERVEAAALAAGYSAAFTTKSGFNRRNVDRFRIRRLDVTGRDSATMLMRKLRLGTNDGSIGNEIGYHLRRFADRLTGAVR